MSRLPILMYHSISSSSNPRFQQFAVPERAFAEQMAYLHEHHYVPMTVTQVAQARSMNVDAIPEQAVVLTFDDGFADFLTTALPILQRYGFVATLYVTTAYVGQTSQWLQHEGEAERPMLTWEQLRTVCSSGIECGGHTHSHPQLDVLPLQLAREEIWQCKHVLEEQLAQEISSFAYPYGYQTAAVRKLVQGAGFHSACAVKNRMSTERDDPFAIARLMVGADLSLQEFVSVLTGQNQSPATVLSQLYARSRTPVWQIVRRGTKAIAQRQKK